MKTKIFLCIIIAVLFGLLVHGHYEIQQARIDYFKWGIYYGVKSLRVLIETKEEDITWNKLYVAAIMMEYDSKEKNPLYDPLKAPLDACQGRGIGVTNYYPQYEPKTNSIKEDSKIYSFASTGRAPCPPKSIE